MKIRIRIPERVPTGSSDTSQFDNIFETIWFHEKISKYASFQIESEVSKWLEIHEIEFIASRSVFKNVL